MRISRYLQSALCAILILVAVAPAQAQEHLVFTPHWRAQAQFAGYYAAKEMGFYSDVGLDVRIEHPSATEPPLERIRSGKSQIVTMQLCQAMDVIENGIPVVNILQTSMNSATLIIFKDKDALQHKEGLRIGTWVNFDAMTYCMSRKELLGVDWIHSVATVSFFLKGGVDAITCMSYNEFNQLIQSGMEFSEGQVYRLADHGYNIQEDGVYMTRDYYRSHKDQARRFAQASRRGWEWVLEHQEEALDIVMRYAHDDAVGTNRTMQRLMLQEILQQQIDKESGEREFRLRRDMVEKASSLMVENGLLKEEIKYEQLIDAL